MGDLFAASVAIESASGGSYTFDPVKTAREVVQLAATASTSGRQNGDNAGDSRVSLKLINDTVQYLKHYHDNVSVSSAFHAFHGHDNNGNGMIQAKDVISQIDVQHKPFTEMQSEKEEPAKLPHLRHPPFSKHIPPKLQRISS